MKLIKLIIVILSMIYSSICIPPSVSVNYLPKKQWKRSKHDLANIKEEIEREMKQKIVEMQSAWKQQRMQEEAMMYNQYVHMTPPNFYQPQMYYNQMNPLEMPGQINNYARFKEKDNSIIEDNSNGDYSQMLSTMQETMEKIKQLKLKLAILKGEDNSADYKANFTKFDDFNSKDSFEDVEKIDEDYNLNRIISKYSKHGVEKEMKIFSTIFKHYNQTDTKDINVQDVSHKIKHGLISENEINNSTVFTKEVYANKPNQLEVNNLRTSNKS